MPTGAARVKSSDSEFDSIPCKTDVTTVFLTVSNSVRHVPETPSSLRHTLQGSSSLFKNSLNNVTKDLRRLLRLTVALTTNLIELHYT